jgi:type IV pilus assembly protein PilM
MNWKRPLSFRQDEVVGLDIGSSSVKVVRLHRDNRGYTVTAAGIAQIQSNQHDGHRADANTVKAISQCLRSADIQTNLAVCSVCGPEVAVRDFRFPSLPPEELEGAIALEAGQSCPFDTADGVIDYEVTSRDQSGLRGVFVAATNAMIKKKLQLAKKASVDCVVMDVDGLALLNCLNEYEPRQPGCAAAILNVGCSYTTLAVMGDNGLPFIRDIACAGDYIVKQIAAQTDQTIEAVTAILSGQPAAGQGKFDYPSQLEEACQRLIIDVNETLRFYTAQEKLSIAKTYVCGGFALVREFIEILDRRLATKALLWNPLAKMSSGSWQHRDALQKDNVLKNGPAMAVAAGLAMRSI